jgi:hypothetical protein
MTPEQDLRSGSGKTSVLMLSQLMIIFLEGLSWSRACQGKQAEHSGRLPASVAGWCGVIGMPQTRS